MSVKTREELIASISALIGEDTSDEAIAFIENVTDTLNNYEAKANGDGTDWKAEAERIDKEWREKYISRFTAGGTDETINKETGEHKTYTYEELFEEKR